MRCAALGSMHFARSCSEHNREWYERFKVSGTQPPVPLAAGRAHTRRQGADGSAHRRVCKTACRHHRLSDSLANWTRENTPIWHVPTCVTTCPSQSHGMTFTYTKQPRRPRRPAAQNPAGKVLKVAHRLVCKPRPCPWRALGAAVASTTASLSALSGVLFPPQKEGTKRQWPRRPAAQNPS